MDVGRLAPSPQLMDLTANEAAEVLAGETKLAAVVPTGSLEFHRSHLPMDHDARHARWVAETAARRLYPRVVVTPPVNVGVSEHWMQHPGTLTVSEDLFTDWITAICTSLSRHGLRRLLILNGHGGNVRPAERLLPEKLDPLPITYRFRSYWDLLAPDASTRLLEGERIPGHAHAFETATALVVNPGRVRSQAPEFAQWARFGADRGAALLGEAVDGTVAVLEELLAEELPEAER